MVLVFLQWLVVVPFRSSCLEFLVNRCFPATVLSYLDKLVTGLWWHAEDFYFLNTSPVQFFFSELSS